MKEIALFLSWQNLYKQIIHWLRGVEPFYSFQSSKSLCGKQHLETMIYFLHDAFETNQSLARFCCSRFCLFHFDI